MSHAFDTASYHSGQVEAFAERVKPDCPTVIEFGGKPFGDFHASRVLPGYDADVKAAIIRDVHSEIGKSAIAMAVHAKDILESPNGRRPAKRIRGDYGNTYDEEAVRMVEEARNKHGIAVANFVITATPNVLSQQNADFIEEYADRLRADFDNVTQLPEIPSYPYLSKEDVVRTLTDREPITDSNEGLLIISPGGGSGKFSVAITELAHKLVQGQSPNFIKFETFPVFNLPTNHPLNRAFIAATADLGNRMVELENGMANYDKDVGNFSLLRTLLAEFPDSKSPMLDFAQPTDMGVNIIERYITDEVLVANACSLEINRRVKRYRLEVAGNSENQATIAATESLLA